MLLLTCQSNTLIFCMEGKTVQEIVRMVDITALPSATGRIDGLLNYRGETIPVIDSCRYLTQTVGSYSLDNSIVIVKLDNQPLALLLHDVLEVQEVASDCISTYQGLSMDFFQSAARLGQEVYPILNLNKIVHDVKHSVQSMQEIA